MGSDITGLLLKVDCHIFTDAPCMIHIVSVSLCFFDFISVPCVCLSACQPGDPSVCMCVCQPGVPAVTVPQPYSALQVLKERADKIGVKQLHLITALDNIKISAVGATVFC